MLCPDPISEPLWSGAVLCRIISDVTILNNELDALTGMRHMRKKVRLGVRLRRINESVRTPKPCSI
jgi:hypothetical protein